MALSLAMLALASPPSRAAEEQVKIPGKLNNLPLPLDCKLGEDCFFQNLPDLDPGPGVTDSFCQTASYDGHKGTDIRVRSLIEAAKGYDVLSMMDGVVLRVRDNMPDKLVITEADRQRVKDIECGNGLVIDHGDGVQVQYCHMKLGSIVVNPGDTVKAGTVLGRIGASGQTQFPHVHVSININGKEIDPNSGYFLAEDKCSPLAEARPLWNETITGNLKKGQTQLLQAGISGIPPDHNSLVLVGGPPTARVGEPVTIGWAWFANLQQGDIIEMTLYRNGEKLVENASEPVERAKASYSQYVGKRRKFEPGDYRLDTSLKRKGADILTDTREIEVK